MARVYAGARAFLYLSREEDFGLSPVEAMAHGIPVIASSDGGAAETVVHGKTGLLIPTVNLLSVMRAMRELESLSFSPSTCRKQAAKFSESVFRKHMRAIISSVTRNSHG